MSERYRLFLGDCRSIVPRLRESSVGSCVTDPPYELGIVGKQWDKSGVAFDAALWAQVLRALKPGSHAAVFGGTRTFHRLMEALEEAGFDIVGCLMWLYGQGFPKSRDISKAIDKAAGKAEERGYIETTGGLHGGTGNTVGRFTGRQLSPNAVTDEAKEWQGWGTALKPSWEPIVLARKPGGDVRGIDPSQDNPERWMLCHSSECVRGERSWACSASCPIRRKLFPEMATLSRFFYCGKATTRDREEGLDDLPASSLRGGVQQYGLKAIDRGRDERRMLFAVEEPEIPAVKVKENVKNVHPTVKPTFLMRWLCKLVTPPGGVILDPFMGSGSTGKAALLDGFRFIGVEMDEHSLRISEHRMRHAAGGDA